MTRVIHLAAGTTVQLELGFHAFHADSKAVMGLAGSISVMQALDRLKPL